MKSKQLYPKSVRPSSTNSCSSSNATKHRVRCSLCDALLKASSTHRYLLSGKSVHDSLDQGVTYGECCRRYLSESCDLNKLHMICPKCCQNLQRIHLLYKDAEQLKQSIQHTWCKTKRLNRARHSHVNYSRIQDGISSSPLPTIATDTEMIISVKEEPDAEDLSVIVKSSLEKIPFNVSKNVVANISHDLSNKTQQHTFQNELSMKIPQSVDRNHNFTNGKASVQKRTPSSSSKKSRGSNPYLPLRSAQASRLRLSNGLECYSNSSHQLINSNQVSSPYAQLMIETPSPSSSSSSHQQHHADIARCDSSDSEQLPSIVKFQQSMDGERSISPATNDDETSSVNGSKATRLSRRQYDFLIKLPDQQSLNAFIESSAADSGSRWTWRRTSANSRGYKVYYVCNFSMRRHYHPCPAAMYALFHPEGSISIYSCGQHQHIPKDRLPVSITDATKDEIFKCLQAGMATTDIREHLTRLQLPFGDTRKLNNFIKYHKELLRFGTVTNVRIGGTAYRQPQCWAIRRQSSCPMPPVVPSTTNDTDATATPPLT
ncbi:unnamed protein product [Adineta ricciae]|uniref:Uncharacterized protein n=1 Tax=Adineta ricciae TaxID=249248 RepID=A0A815DCW1_ADIRI|nr:unnamed protein product [Adineta ricciae]